MQEGLEKLNRKMQIIKIVEQKLLKFLPGEHRVWESSGIEAPTQTSLFHLH